MTNFFDNTITSFTRTNADLVTEISESIVKYQPAFNKSFIPSENSMQKLFMNFIVLPYQISFDLTKDAYVNATKSKLIEPSIISSTKVFKAISSLEKATLGNFARY